MQGYTDEGLHADGSQVGFDFFNRYCYVTLLWLIVVLLFCFVPCNALYKLIHSRQKGFLELRRVLILLLCRIW